MASRKRPYTAADVRQLLEDSDSDTYVSDSGDSGDESDDTDADDAADSGSVNISADNWQRANKEQPHIYGFLGKPGISVNTDGFEAIDFFRLFLTDELLSIFEVETNRYADQLLQQLLPPQSRLRKWENTNVEEMKIFCGLLFLMAINRKPEIAMYWTQDSLFSTPVFPAVMTRDRFQVLLRCWHFVNNECAPARNSDNYDRLFKIQPLIKSLSATFESVYTPDTNLSLDEELVLWKGRLVFRQYIPMKRARFGMKLFCLCENTGYTYRFRVYTGKDNPMQAIYCDIPDDAQELSKTEKIVVHLMEPLLDKGYQFYVDNFYTSVNLVSYLDDHATGCCGTVRGNRVPAPVKNHKLDKGASVGFRKDNLLCVKFKDKRDVFVLTNIHTEETSRQRVRGRHEVFVDRPVCICDYNRNMGGVDKVDQLIAPYDATRKCLKWYRKLAVHLLQVAMVNAFTLYQKSHSSARFLKFQTDVISSLVFDVALEPDTTKSEELARLTERHFLSHTPETAKGGRKNFLTRRCRVCHKNGIRKEVTYLCEQCSSHPGLCPVPCFQLYHTKKKYWQ